MKFLVPLALLTVITVGSAAPLWLPLPATPPPTLLAQAMRPAAPISLQAVPLAPNKVVSFVSSPIAAPVAGTLVETYFYEGQYVRRGQVLAKLRVRATKATAYLNAPHDGVLSRALVPVGELLPANSPLTTLTDQTRVRVRLHPVAARHLHAGDSIQVALAGQPSVTVRGKITQWATLSPATPELTLQLHRAVSGATVGSSLTVAHAEGPRKHLVVTNDALPAPPRKLMHYSQPVAQE